MAKTSAEGTVAERLKKLGVRGVLVLMAKDGQILQLKCEMPNCYCPKGRGHFDPRSQPMTDWAANPDHYPKLKMDGGELVPWNVRLAHVLCNRVDHGWRTKIRTMLEKDPTLSFAAIADALNRKKTVLVPPNAKAWTARLVRKVYTS